MVSGRRYILISPCRNEGERLSRTIESVLAQTLPPHVWVIVDDGSTDETAEILSRFARTHEFIKIIGREDRGHRSVGPGVIEAFVTGLEFLGNESFDYLCKLDLDLDLPPAYFERLIAHMERDPRLGTCSGKSYVEAVGGRLEAEPAGDEMSVGMTKFYRRECFEEIGGFVRAVMWDGIDCHRCRMLGWKAASFDEPDLRFIHLRPMGSSQKGIWTGRVRHGFGQYFMGTSLAYVTASAVYRAFKWPFVLGGLAIWWGYFRSMLQRAGRYDDSRFRSFLRRYQRSCLLKGKRRATEQLNRQIDRRAQMEADPDHWPKKIVAVGGVEFASVTEPEVVDHVGKRLAAQVGGWIITPNGDILRRIGRDVEARELVDKASFCVADGMPIVWASAILGSRVPGRVTGSNLIWSLSEMAAKDGRSVFLLGGNPGSAAAAADVLISQYAQLAIAGTHCPPMRFEDDDQELDRIRQKLLESKPDIIFVGLGFPKQEKLIELLRPQFPEAWWMGVGISFSFVAGEVRRAPKWMQSMGLEWVHRLLQEPGRLLTRYIVHGFPFTVSLLMGSARDRIFEKSA